MPKRIKDTSKKLSKISTEELAKALGAEIISPLEELVGETDSIPVGDPIVFVPSGHPFHPSFDHKLQYVLGQYAAHRNIDRNNIVGYKRLKGKALATLEQEVGARGWGIQFYARKEDELQIKERYKPSPCRIYMI